MTDELTIVLPLPPKELNPNRQWTLHWAAKARAVKNYKQAAYAATIEAGGYQRLWPRAVARPVFYWPDRRTRDTDNAEAALKAAYDGMVTAHLIIDDNARVLRREPALFAVDKANPRVEIRIQRLERTRILSESP